MILVKMQTPTPDLLGAANGVSEIVQMVGSMLGASFARFVPYTACSMR
jgi:hypothetical protein